MGKDFVLVNTAIIQLLYYADPYARQKFQFYDNIRVLQFITFTVIYIYRGSRVYIFRADIQLFHFFPFFYMGRNDAVEHCAKISHVSLERCILWNDDKMINLCSLMRYFSYDASVMYFTMPVRFILKSGDNKLPCATWQKLKIGESLSALLKTRMFLSNSRKPQQKFFHEQ